VKKRMSARRGVGFRAIKALPADASRLRQGHPRSRGGCPRRSGYQRSRYGDLAVGVWPEPAPDPARPQREQLELLQDGFLARHQDLSSLGVSDDPHTLVAVVQVGASFSSGGGATSETEKPAQRVALTGLVFSNNLVGAIGFEPTTPTVSRRRQAFRGGTRRYVCRGIRYSGVLERPARYAEVGCKVVCIWRRVRQRHGWRKRSSQMASARRVLPSRHDDTKTSCPSARGPTGAR
jgi:hypothetical protein